MIARLLYQNPRMLLLVAVVISVVGAAALTVIPRLEDPVLGRRVGVISVVFPGANARRIESLVSIPLETQLRGIGDIREIRSNSRAGICVLVVELKAEVSDAAPVWQLVRERLLDAQSELPAACQRPTLEVFPLKAFAAILAVWPRDGVATLSDVRPCVADLQSQLLDLPGTESMEIFGDPGDEIVVRVAPRVLRSWGSSTAMIAQQLAAGNVTQPGGALGGDDAELPVELEAMDDSLRAIADALLTPSPAAAPVRLGDVAEMQRSLSSRIADAALPDGRPGIVLALHVDDETRLDRWTDACRRRVAECQNRFAGVSEVDILFAQNDFIARRLHSLRRNLLLGIVAVTAVVGILMGWRSMLVVASTLPLSALIVIAGMRALGVPLHQMSVTGLIVAMGLLIDNAIVMVEDIRGRIRRGAAADDAIRNSIAHLRMPLFASTVTTALTFLPIAMLPGPAGEFVGAIAVSVILAIFASLALSLTVVPAMLRVLRGSRAKVGHAGLSSRSLTAAYEASLRFVFRHPVLGVVLGTVLPALGYVVAFDLPEQFFPLSDRNQVSVEIELPAREPLDRTLQVVEQVHETVVDRGPVQRVHWFAGRSAPTFYYNLVARRRASPYYAQAIVDLVPGTDPRQVVGELQAALDPQHPECRVIVRPLDQGPPIDAPIELRLFGSELAQLRELGDQLRCLLSQTDHVIHTRSDLGQTIPALRIEIDEQQAIRTGLSEADVAGLLYTSLEGASASSVFADGEELPVRVVADGLTRDRLDRLAALPLPIRRQGPPPGGPGSPPPAPRSTSLGAVASFGLASLPAAITRINGRRVNEVKAYIDAGTLAAQALADFRERLAESDFELPAGYQLQFAGEDAERAAAVGHLLANAAVLSAALVLTLVAVFQSFRAASMIVVVGLLAAGLGPLALWMFGFPFGFMAIVGVMGLVGVAINDSIVVLAALGEHPGAGAGDREAVVRVVSSCTRHVLATTMTTIAGFTPLILGGGGFWPPLAISIAGGVGGATFLALYFMPSIYILLRRPVRAAAS